MMISLQNLLQLCHLPLLASGILLSPTGLSVTSENFKHILTWEEPNNESAIFYHVEYKINYREPFSTVANCSNITADRCDLTKVFSGIWNSYMARVQSFTSTERSHPSLSSPVFKPLTDTVVGPPIVDVVAADSGINITISLPVSYLWDEVKQRFVSILTAYPSIDYYIFLEPSTKVSIFEEAVALERFTVTIPSLLPSTTYCVNVSMDSENINISITSPKKCAITKGAQLEGENKVYWIVAGVLLFIMLLLLLIVLDQAGYISKKKVFTPKVLASLPDSRSLLHGPDQLCPLIPMIPMEFVHSLENEHISEDPATMDSAQYIAHNPNAGKEEQQEDLNQDNSLNCNGAPTSEHSEGPLLNITEVVLSEGPSVQPRMSIGDSISTKHPAVIPVSERLLEAPCEDAVGGTENLLTNLTYGSDDSLDLSLRHNNVSIDLNSVTLGDSVDLLTNVPPVPSPKDSLKILASHPNGDAVNISQFTLLCSVINSDASSMENLDNEDWDQGSDLNCASDYIKR